MITLLQAISQAADTPINEWTMVEMLAVSVSNRERDILRLRKELAKAEERYCRAKANWERFVENNA